MNIVRRPMIVGVSLLAWWFPSLCVAIDVCDGLRRSWSLRDSVVTVTGELWISHHGLVLASRKECPGLDGYLTSWPSSMYLVRTESTKVSRRVQEVIISPQLAGQPAPRREVVIRGVLERKLFPLIFRMRGGGHAGDGYGETGLFAVRILMSSIDLRE